MLKKIGTVLAFTLASTLLVAPAQAGKLQAIADNLCVVDDSGKFKGGVGGVVTNRLAKETSKIPLWGKLKGTATSATSVVVDKVKDKTQDWFSSSVVCSADTQEERWVLTAMLLDRAAISAAVGVNEARAALNLKAQSVSDIASIERALDGLGTGGSNVTVTTIKSASAQAAIIREQVAKIREKGGLSDEAREHLINAANELDKVDYYGATSVAGIKLLNDYFASSNVENIEKIETVIASLGLDKNTLRRMGNQAKSVTAAMSGMVMLRRAIGDVLRDDFQSDKSAKKAENKARKVAKKDQDKVQKEIKSKGGGTPV